jgi:hypothetical protein
MILTIGAGAIVVIDNLGPGPEEARAREFQQLVGGLGLGPAVDLGRCPFSFDPRVSHRCPQDLGPIPGGGCFCPRHACSILYYPALETAP